MQPTRVLHQRPLPRHRHRQKEAVEPCVVETLADVAASCKDKSLFTFGEAGEPYAKLTPLLVTHTSLEDNEVTNEPTHLVCEDLEVIPSLGEEDWGTTFFQSMEDVIQDETVARLVLSKRPVDVLDTSVRTSIV